MSTQTLDSLCSVNPETLSTATPMDMEFRYLDISAVTKGRIDWLATRLWKYADAPSRARRRLRLGDVLLCTVRPGLQAHTRIRQEEYAPLVGSTGFAVLRPDLAGDSGFVFHQLFSDPVAAQLRAIETGSSYPAVNEGDVRRLRVFCPEKEERWRIAAVLDTVDEAIAKTEAVIAKLRQVRAGLLHDLLTRGLDQNGQLRDPIAHPEQFQDSPLGRIPREWTVEALESCCSHVIDCPHSTPNYLTAGVLVARTMHIRDGRYDVESSSRVTEEEFVERIARLEPQPGDVIFTREAPVGEAFVIPPGIRICLGQRVMLLRPRDEKLTGGYLMPQIYSGAVRQRIDSLTGGTTNPHLNVAEVRKFTVPLPEMDEQQRIAACLSAHDALMESETAQLNKLQHLKSGLMTDLLTGRVRVSANQ